MRAATSLLRAPRIRPSAAANLGRNLLAGPEREPRWKPARDRLWTLLDPLVNDGARVAVVGAGNAHDIPLRRLADRGARVALIDIDRRAIATARRRQPRAVRSRLSVVEHDITDGVADQVVTAAIRARVPATPTVPETPLPGAPYDLVVGDLFYSQLLYPALLDHGVPERRRRAFLDAYGPRIVRGVIARLHASSPVVVHLHDPLGWWAEHEQPFTLDRILGLARTDVERALAAIRDGCGPADADPRAALDHFGIPILGTQLWRWPFCSGTDYLVCASVART